jgi:hypothetical protein
LVLIEIGKQSASIEWPAFVGYCICTAGTVHVHGTHYKGTHDSEVFSQSSSFLSREMQQLSELRYAWSSVQHQRETLQTIYGCHSELVKSLASNPMRYSPVFHLEDFFDRYSDLGQFFDGAHISFSDILVDPTQETYTGHDLYAPRSNSNTSLPSNSMSDPTPSLAKRKQSSSAAARKKHLDLKISHANSHAQRNGGHPENVLLTPSNTLDSSSHLDQNMMQQSMLDPTSTPITPFAPNGGMPNLSQTPFSPPYAFSSLQQPESYDPMFGMQMGFYSSTSNHTHSMNENGMGGANTMGGDGMNGDGLGNGMNGGMGGEEMTPGGQSTGTEGEKDPFLSLLEQLAENEHSRGGPSELDFFLSGGNG